MIMDDRAQMMAVLGICATIAISVVSIAQAYVRSIEARRRSSEPELDPNVQDRMSRIEHAVDAIAIEVERMSEGQRFTTRLLAEQFGDAGRARGGAEQSGARLRGPDTTNGAGGSNAR
jgi:hypothetical protein